MKKYRRTIITITILILIIAFFIYRYFDNQTKWNEEDVDGAMVGNLYNDGLFHEYDGYIFFSNSDDDGSLYRMDANLKNASKLKNDKVKMINSSGSYVYYARMNNLKSTKPNTILEFTNVGLFRTNTDGSNIKSLDNSVVAGTHQYGNYIYYQRYDKEGAFSLYRVKIDGKDQQQLLSEPIDIVSIKDNKLYYTGVLYDHNIYQLDLVTLESTLVKEGNYSKVIYFDHNLYYIDLSADYQIGRMSLADSESQVLVNQRVVTYNLTPDGKYLYYQVEAEDNHRLCRLNLTTMEEVTLMEGDYSNINVTKEYVFFHEFNTSKMYATKIGESTDVFEFNLPSTH